MRKLSSWTVPGVVAGAVAGVAAAVVGGCGGSDDDLQPVGGGPGSSSGGATSSGAPAADASSTPPPDPFAGPVQEPAPISTSEADVVTIVRTKDERRAISPLIYGINVATADADRPDDVMKCVTFVRRGGDRANAYDWENGVSNGSHNNGFQSDLFLGDGLADKTSPAALDLELIRRNVAAGRGTMVPFVMNDFVARTPATYIPYASAGGWDRAAFFDRVELVKPTPFDLVPNLDDGVVYTDEHVDFLQRKYPAVFAPGPTELIVGTDNEPDLFAYNFPMLQNGNGDDLTVDGVVVGKRVMGDQFTERFVRFARRIKEIAPRTPIAGPGHYAFDGWTTWHGSMNDRYGNGGDAAWYLDDFLRGVKQASEQAGVRLLDTWDMHWYPQREFNGVYTHLLDDSQTPMTADEIEAVLQSPRSYWDPEYDEQSWITRDHMHEPTKILVRLQQRIDAAYPGTKLGVTEYFPGGRGHVSSGLATVDSLGVFARFGVELAAMWPHPGRVEYAYGGIQLLRDASGTGVRFADAMVKVEHPEKIDSSLYAGADTPEVVTVSVVNKTQAPRRFALRFYNPGALGSVDVYRIDAEHPDPFAAGAEPLTRYNAHVYTAPPLSASLLVFRK